MTARYLPAQERRSVTVETVLALAAEWALGATRYRL
jgi:hypothetical protein